MPANWTLARVNMRRASAAGGLIGSGLGVRAFIGLGFPSHLAHWKP